MNLAIHELIVRFTDQASYYLTYGNKRADRPNYDIEHFSNNIPKTLTALNLGGELTIEKDAVSTTDPLFKNKIWLWIVITIIILLLGWFSVELIKKN